MERIEFPESDISCGWKKVGSMDDEITTVTIVERLIFALLISLSYSISFLKVCHLSSEIID